MQRFALKWIAIAVMALSSVACANEGVGDPCLPESVPCTGGSCGFRQSESYVESSSVQCRSRVCIVHKLKGGAELGDPRDVVKEDEQVDQDPSMTGRQADGPAAVSASELARSVHCTCRCKDGNGKKIEECECPEGFKCEQILTLGGDGIRGSYCVRPPPS